MCYNHKGVDYILDTPNTELDFIEMLGDCLDGEEIVDILNQLSDENEQLKQEYTKLKHKHSLLHDECLDAECDKDRYYKDMLSLEEENEELKQFKTKVFDLLDEKIKEEEYSAMIISDVLHLNEDYEKPVNVLTIATLTQLKKELKDNV